MKLKKYVILIILLAAVASSATTSYRYRERINIMLLDAVNTVAPGDFKSSQMRYPKVKKAFEEKKAILKALMEEKDLCYPPEKIFLRGLKEERQLELWVKAKDQQKFQLLKSYEFQKLSGELGPKRKEGDRQVPEGFYYIDRFNPDSRFFLSLGLNYPNESDKIIGDKEKPGFDIFIHGGTSSVGCIPVGDEEIKEIYSLAVEVKSRGQEKIPVHIFPSRLDSDGMDYLRKRYSQDSGLIAFWENLQEGYKTFEENKIPPECTVDPQGKYVLKK